MTAPLISLEDLIYSKIYVAGRDRFDGGYMAHLIRKASEKIDWTRVLDQLGDDYGLLLWHLILYDYIYPGKLREDELKLILLLFKRVREAWPAAKPPLSFRGPLIDPICFKTDMEETGYSDPKDMTPWSIRKGTSYENCGNRGPPF